MRIAYCSLLLPEDKHLAERSKKRLSGVSGHKVMSATIYGIQANLQKPITVFNFINTLNYPAFPQLFFKTEKWSHIEGANDLHLGYINLFGIKYITQAIKMYFSLRKWAKQQGENECLICVHHVFFPSMLAVLSIKKRFKNTVKICLNTADIPGKFGLTSNPSASLKGYLITHLIDPMILKMIRYFDCHVFATKDMAHAICGEKKPFVVIEGVYLGKTTGLDMQVKDDTEEKVIFYAGALRNEYGIDHLLRAFVQITDPRYRLVIAGGGNAESQVVQYAQKDKRIKYLGFISPAEVEKQQSKARVIVSPRQSKHDFVRFSFPSKALDALASGIPYVAHRLPCDPPEYAEYIQYTKDESDASLRDKLQEICELPYQQRKEIGERARMFILNEKKPEKICRKIVTMWEMLR